MEKVAIFIKSTLHIIHFNNLKIYIEEINPIGSEHKQK